MSITIHKATEQEAETIAQIGRASYYTTYPEILSADQIEFMLEKSYTASAIRQLMKEGHLFYIIYDEGEEQGFLSVRLKPQDTAVLRIEKLYLLAVAQKKGFGKRLISFAEEEGVRFGCKVLELNVNRNNPAYHFYKKEGFHVSEEVDIPYFGYVLDDYVMQRLLP
ncbi:GNAT family N-acetyltransferase [Sphingobacterium spiritivorum]|uniref:GNAT family N-acetyltransferase n=1 Tax=Sphingobacterium spiritivorum TaxID=258 RepID=UPI003DA69BB6